MLTERELRKIVDEAIVKYAVRNDGIKGWAREDIEASINTLGGSREDLYRAMRIGFEACFEDLDHYIS